jgi:hypothetical protein
MPRLAIALALILFCCPREIAAQEISFEVDLKNPPPNTSIRLGEGKSAEIGKTAKFDLAIMTSYGSRKELREEAKKHAALLAHTSLNNAARIDSVSKKLTKFPEEFDLTKLEFQQVSLTLVSLKEIERGGVKVVQFELNPTVGFTMGQIGRAIQHKKYEVWEFDGKKLRLIEAPEDWGIILL